MKELEEESRKEKAALEQMNVSSVMHMMIKHF
jgi:hypothetical protein